ncbi:MAG TPA: prepilin-type N-terminal cleavage/methylation domain-containing protein [Vicinamibacteria bacterium]|nr:prepilin-type N-terminal cleavage/methylation domain-containing protein [Vicinamibacteria bacterium]
MSSPTRSLRPRPAAGFTLIELLVVLAIIAILAAASIPYGLNYVRTYKIMGAAQGIVGEVQKARSQAVKRNAARGILLNFNYPEVGQVQFTSLEADPTTGNWDGVYYPANPGVFDPTTTVDYGMVPTPPNNLIDPDLAGGVQSPHGFPIDLPQTIGFEPGDRNALLFRADGSVAAVNATGPVGPAALRQDGADWLVTLRDGTTQLTRTIRVSSGGRVRLEPR